MPIPNLRNAVVVGVLAVLSIARVKGQIYESGGFSVSRTNLDGTGNNATFISNLPSSPEDMAVSGNNLFVSFPSTGTVAEYNATTGAPINTALLTGLSQPFGLATMGEFLFVANQGDDSIGCFNLSTNTYSVLISSVSVNGQPYPLNTPNALAVSGNELFVTNNDGVNGGVGKYTIAEGQVISSTPNFIPNPQGFGALYGIAVSGNSLLFSYNNTWVAKYDATTGTLINATFLPFTVARGLASSGNDLYVVDQQGGGVKEYDATTGVLVNNIGGGLTSPFGVAVATQTSATVVATDTPLFPVWAYGVLVVALFLLGAKRLLHE